MIVSTDLIYFFCEYVLNFYSENQFFVLKNDYYWSFSFGNLFSEQTVFYSPGYGSLYDDIFSLKKINAIEDFMTWETLGQLAIILLEIGKMNVKESNLIRNEFTFSKKDLIKSFSFILKKIEFTGNHTIEITMTKCWYFSYQSFFYLDSRPNAAYVDFEPKILKLISIYNGDSSLKEFNIEDFFWFLKIYFYNLENLTKNAAFWICQSSPNE